MTKEEEEKKEEEEEKKKKREQKSTTKTATPTRRSYHAFPRVLRSPPSRRSFEAAFGEGCLVDQTADAAAGAGKYNIGDYDNYKDGGENAAVVTAEEEEEEEEEHNDL